MWQIWIDTGGTFTDGLALDPGGELHRAKVLSSSRLRGELSGGRVRASWLKAPIFAGYTLRLVETGETYLVESLGADGTLAVAGGTYLADGTVELFTHEEAPVLATRLLTQTPLNQSFPPLAMRLGTTRGTNALLERRGARVALLVTEGFRDLLVIGTQQRPDLFQLAIPPAEVLYHTVLDVSERMTATGEVLLPLTDAHVGQVVAQVRAARPDADAVAISLLNAYRNPRHERQLGAALAAAGFGVITLSTDISAAPGYLARTQTAVVNAYLTPVLDTYLRNIRAQLGGHPVHVMSSTGGLVRADLFQPKDSLLSGPAGGVVGAAAVAAETYGATKNVPGQQLLTLDMGGTSTDVARLENGQPDYREMTSIGPFELQLPSLAIETVAAGGGSVCWFDALTGQLRVGPHSAGASPGPACYGATPVGTSAGQPLLLTITDVNLLLGKLHPRQFGIPIYPENAQQALDDVVRQVAQTTYQAPDALTLLRGFEQIANERMAGAIRNISVSKGFDPAHYGLLVFGGAGGLHGCAIARLLGMSRLLLPYDGGLLSAYGIGMAPVERRASQPVLQPLTYALPDLPGFFDEQIRLLTSQLREDVGPVVPVSVVEKTVFLRLEGQENTLPISVEKTPMADLETVFRQAYNRLYGYVPEGRALELVSIRAAVSTVPSVAPTLPPPTATQPATASFQTDRCPAYDWTTLQPGDTFSGPALLLNATSSAFIEMGWSVCIQPNKTAVAVAETQPTEPLAGVEQDVIQLELFTQRFRAVADEMGAQLQRTAFSVNVRERLDFSCALLDAQARLVVNAPHIPVHLGSLGLCARLVLAHLRQAGTPLGPGDVAVTNHPKYGGSHLPDVTLLQGVFVENELVGYVINRAHHAEIGGRTPGSMPPDATSLAEEGVVLEPQFLVRNGQFLWETIRSLFTQAPYPTRALAENRADLEAAMASLKTGETALHQLVTAHGLAPIRTYMARLQQSATAALAGVLARYEGQTFEATEFLDDDQNTGPYPIQVRMSVRSGVPASQTLTVDLRGTGPMHPNNLNANVSILHSAVLYVLRLWVGEQIDATHIPLNEGLMEPVRFILPQSSFLNPVFADDPTGHCPAVVGGNTEVSQRLVDTLLKALGAGGMRPVACSQGTMNNFLFGNDTLGYYETLGGGAGAVWGQAGRSGVHQHMTNTRLTDPETLERRYPVRLWRFGLRTGSGGAGQWRGGDGLVREIEFLAPMQVTLLSQHRLVVPYGAAGGLPGTVGQQTLLLPNGEEISLPGTFTRQLTVGERIRVETPGGGGVGVPPALAD